MTRLPDEIKPCMQGFIPSTVVTCSQVYWVDHEHVALSFQFFNKTIRNVRENPRAQVLVVDPTEFICWELGIEYLHSEEEGPIFDAMDMQIEAIASMTGMSGIFKLKAADIYRVSSVEKVIPR
jgi:uncharacterized protein